MKRSIKLLAFIFSVFVSYLQAQNIYTYAGTGVAGYSGDGGPATAAQMEATTGVVTDGLGNLYICEWTYGLIRKVDASGIITTIAGGAVADLSDGIPATAALVKHPWGITMDAAGNIYFAEQHYNQVRKINTSGIITTIAGVANTSGGFSGDGGLATSAFLKGPSDVAVDAAGNVYIADATNHRIRMVNTSGIISTIAGSSLGFSGDGGLAVNAKFNLPLGIAVDINNNIYIGDAQNHRIRKIDNTGIISTICGTGVQANSGDGGPATMAEMGSTRGLQADDFGNLFFADRYYGTIRKIDASGIITNIAGTGMPGSSGDGGPASLAQITPIDVTFDNAGNFYISDGARVRKVCGSSPLTVISSMSITCASESATLSVSGTGTYTWSTGTTNSAIVVAPTVTTTYTVNSADMVGCSYNGTITQSVNPVPSITVASSSSVICTSESATLTASGAASYTWSTGSVNQSIVVTPAATESFTVSGSTMDGCSASAAITQSVSCVGLNEYFRNGIKIYPNPATNVLYITDEENSFEGSQIVVSNSLGQSVLKQDYSNAIDVSKLPAGLFTLKILTKDKKNFYSKFIKE